MSDPPLLRIGIAGLGQAGSALLPAMGRHPQVAVVAAADPRPAVRSAFHRDFGVPVYPDIEALCAEPAVDLVYIATPTHLHHAHALLALAHAKHVILEKPMALTLVEGQGLIKAAKRADRQLIVGHSQSFEPPIRALREVVRSGELGRLRMLHTWYYTDWLYRPRTPAELDSELGGGVLFRQGAHQVDLLRWIGGGLVRSVRAVTGSWDSARPAVGSHTLFLTFEGGAVATAVFSGYDHFDTSALTFGLGEGGRPIPNAGQSEARARLAAAGSAGEAALKADLGYGSATPAAEPSAASFYGITIVSCERGDIRQTPVGLTIHGDTGPHEVTILALPSGRDVLLAEAYEAVVHGAAPAHDGPWALANLEVCLAAAESSRTHAEVALFHQVPTRE